MIKGKLVEQIESSTHLWITLLSKQKICHNKVVKSLRKEGLEIEKALRLQSSFLINCL